jgi:hypothetical protein
MDYTRAINLLLVAAGCLIIIGCISLAQGVWGDIPLLVLGAAMIGEWVYLMKRRKGRGGAKRSMRRPFAK